ncbi:MAG TPA: AAA family ATPase [Usitatibacter sp.]|jgi:MoxR-like ATPase|nr:AAA family ATPase [Usitatibacter sp.]
MANVRLLADALGLTAVEHDVMALFAAVPSQPALQQALGRIDIRSRHQMTSALAVILGHPLDEVRQALGPDGNLARFQIVRIFDGAAYDFSQLALLNDDLERALSSASADLDEILSAFFHKAPPPSLEFVDFQHLQPLVGTLLNYLRGAAERGAVGINVLLYGLPGTGKTELARLAAKELGWTAFEVKMCNRDGAPSSGDERVGSYLLAQRLLENMGDRLVIFDEFEDLFSPDFGFQRARMGKLFMNRLLESNHVPAVFIANDVSALSLAARRRFDLSIGFGALPLAARASVLSRHLDAKRLDEVTRQRLQRRHALVPAQVATGQKVSDLSNGSQEVVVQAIDASMRLLEQPMPREAPELEFELALAHADCDLGTVVDGVRGPSKKLTLALHGPPGVGKSALARFICKEIQREPVQISASDVLSAFVGETEQRLAAIFQAVDPRAEVVVLEEADELLGARSGARQSWEVRLVNELLGQIDAFGGVIVITTNAIDRIDPAALRRCALKIRLDYLSADQRLHMWRRKVGAAPAPDIVQGLMRLDQLTAGDFAAVTQQADVVGRNWTPDDWLIALEREAALKPRVPNPAGFVQQ